MERIFDDGKIQDFVEKYNMKDILCNEIIKNTKLYKFDKGELVCSNGDKLKHLYFLVKGKMKIYTSLENGRAILLRFYTPLSIVGDIELLSDYKVKFNVECVTESYLLAIDTKDVLSFAYDNPVFLRFIIKHLSHKLYTNSISNTINILYPVENRVASYLLSISSDENNAFHIEEIKTSKLSEIADLLGTSYRHINRVMSKFESLNIVSRHRGSIIVRDIEKLKELSRGNFYE